MNTCFQRKSLVVLAGALVLAFACENQSVSSDPESNGACDEPVSRSIWAMWSMPNPHLDDLPNAAGYTDLGDGTVRDNMTCLVWEREVDEGVYTWNEAKAYCDSLKLAGGGWRMPTRIELVSLLDFSKPIPGPTIDTVAFPDTPAQMFWSSSSTVGGEFFWYVNFYSGSTSNELPVMDSRVRCVR